MEDSSLVGNYSQSGLATVLKSLVISLSTYNAAVSRKLELAVVQLSSAGSVEQFQQLGILMRDAWVEFSQSIYTEDCLPDGTDSPSPTDAKRMTEYVLRNVGQSAQHLLEMSKTTYDLCNKLEHDLKATREMATQCVSVTGLCMVLILNCLASARLLVKRPYYKCPNCGSINFRIREEWVQDFDGAFKVNKLFCSNCNWFYVEEMGGMSGVE